MDLQMTKGISNSGECFCENKCEQAVSLEINLPDYCSDIKRILKCIVTPGVANISVSGEAVTLTGVVVTRLVYVGEDDRIDCYENNSPLSCSTRIKDLPDGACFKACAKTDYINCRALSQRKFNINGSIGVNLGVYCENKRELPEKISGCGVETKTEKVKIKNLICQSEKTFDLSETVAIDSSLPDIAKIIRCSCYPRLTSQRAVSDKLLVKGELCCKIVYCTEKENKLYTIEHSMPISQIMDLPGIDENSDISVSFSCRQSITAVKSDSSGKGRLLEIAARVSAFVKCSKEKEIITVGDCYSTEYDLKGEYKFLEFLIPVLDECRSLTKEKSLEFSSEKIKEILDMWHSDIKCNLAPKGNELRGECSFLLSGIYRDESSALHYGEKNVEFDIELPLNEKSDSIRCNCSAEMLSPEFSLLADGKIKIKGEINLGCEAYAVKTKRVLTNLEIDENSKKSDSGAALTLYFADENESLWDIARKYNTTVKLICEENSLTGEKLPEDKMLLIPCV